MWHLLFILHYKWVYYRRVISIWSKKNYAFLQMQPCMKWLHLCRLTTSGHICECQSEFSGAFLCVTQRTQRGGPTTPDVTLPVCLSCQGICFSPSPIPVHFYVKHLVAHADILYHLSQLTLKTSLCCPLLGTFTPVSIC